MIRSAIRDLYYLATEAAAVPVLLGQAVAQGLALGWKTSHPDPDSRDQIIHGPKWNTSDPIPPGICALVMPEQPFAWRPHVFQTSSPDGEVSAGSADPAGEGRPAADSAILSAAAAGPPNHEYPDPLAMFKWRSAAEVVDTYWRSNHPSAAAAAAIGLRQWISGEPCTAPTYFGSICRDLDQLAK